MCVLFPFYWKSSYAHNYANHSIPVLIVERGNIYFVKLLCILGSESSAK